MNYDSAKRTLRIFTVIFSIAAVISLFMGWDKMNRYVSADDRYDDPHNAYVGGDAYNFIINGTYASAYYSLSAGFLISSTLCLVGGYVVEGFEANDRKRKEANNELIKSLKENSASKTVNKTTDTRLPEL